MSGHDVVGSEVEVAIPLEGTTRNPFLEQIDESFLAPLIEKTLPAGVAESLDALLGSTMAKNERGLYDIVLAGRFAGMDTANLLTYAEQDSRTGALVVVERDCERVLYFADGTLVGAASSELFERVGRLLYSAKIVDKDDSKILVKAEKELGTQSLLLWLSSEQLTWALNRRVWEAAASIHLVKRGHFVFIAGEPQLGGTTVALKPTDVGLEARSRYDEWRSGSSDVDENYQPPGLEKTPPPLDHPLKPIDVSPEALQAILERIQEAESFKPGE